MEYINVHSGAGEASLINLKDGDKSARLLGDGNLRSS